MWSTFGGAAADDVVTDASVVTGAVVEGVISTTTCVFSGFATGSGAVDCSVAAVEVGWTGTAG